MFIKIPIIKIGSTRIVFIFKNFVIKIPTIKEIRLFKKGLKCNLSENRLSKIGRTDLARVKFCSPNGVFLIMEKATPVDLNINWLNFLFMLEEKYKNDTMKDTMLLDSKPSNWGFIDKRLVKIDYANN